MTLAGTRWRARLLVAGVLLVGLTASGARCHSGLYVLEAESAWVEGCIEGPCLCPVSQGPLTGRFNLEELPTLQPGPARYFEISAIRWLIGSGPDAREVTGHGFYTTSAPVLDDQQLVLELEIDGDPIGSIDSGVVPGGLAFPRIAIQALTAGSCFQSGVILQAVPFGA